MPFGDRTGPRGMGPMTGRGAGYCSGSDRPGFASPGLGRGWSGAGRGPGRGLGGGMGFGFRGASPPWPYVGRGRGGLPRCGYYTAGAGTAPAPAYPPDAAPLARDEELDYLKGQAEAMKGRLDEIESRMRELGEDKPQAK